MPSLVLEVAAVPRSLNYFVGRSRWAYRRQKAPWIRALADAYRLALIQDPRGVRTWPTPPTGRVRCTIARITPRANALDLDNLYGACKPVIDALRALQLLGADDAAALELHVEQPKGAPKQYATRVTLALSAGPGGSEETP